MLSLAASAPPTFAADTEIPISPAINTEDNTDANGNFTSIDKLGDATYYVQKTDDYTVAIGLYDKVVDCSIRYNAKDTISSAIVPIEKLSLFLPEMRSNNQIAQFESIKGAIINGSLTLEEMTLQNSSTLNEPTTRVTSGEKTKIMTELYNAGWPQAYTNYLRASKTQNGVTAKLYHTLNYNIKDHSNRFYAIESAVSAFLAFTGLPTSKILRIVSFALAADGVYKSIKDVTVQKFEVYAYEDKEVVINNIQPYRAGKTVKWMAVTGDLGAALTLQYENKDNDFDNNTGLLDTGLRNYANM